jgi:PhzF family phenazine biosynthesis protein
VRYFSPEAEVAFCGHATIATGVALAERDPALEQVSLHTRSERVEVAVGREDGRVLARLTSPPASQEPVTGEVLDAALATFGWDRGVLDPAVPPVVASAGVRHLVLAVDTRERLAAMTYDFDRLRDLMLAEGWTTVDVVWRESATRLHARNPFPVGGVVEDPATGAAAAALGGYLRDAGLVEVPARLTVLQGEDLGRPSVLVVDVPAGTGGIDVSGTAVPMT